MQNALYNELKNWVYYQLVSQIYIIQSYY